MASPGKAEAGRDGGGAEGAAAGRGSGGKLKVDVFLGFCRIVNTVTAISAILCFVGFCMAIVAALHTDGFSVRRARDLELQVLRIYGMVIAAGLAVVETEWQWVLGCMRLMESWVARGLCQAFLSVLTLQLVTSEGESDFDKSVRLYRTVAGMCLLACSSFYFLGGVLCVGVIKNARYKRRLERVRVERDLESLAKQQEELGRLLAVYTKE